MSLPLSSDSFDASAPDIQANQTLLGSSSRYSVLEFIGEGCFGKVAKCQNLETKETVAVKFLKTDADSVQDIEKEVSMLNVISVLNPDLCNVVNFFERFQHMGQTCLVFEMLDRNLFELLQELDFEPLFTNVIRPIAAQLLAALDALKGLGIVHADIKPDNVMLVDARDQSLRVKLIDFGRAVPVSSIQPGLSLQPVGYRAPEVVLGLPFSEAIDVWGVGCVLAFLYLANNLFPVSCYYQMMRRIVDVLGQPQDHMLRAGRYTHYYFMEEKAADGRRWRLMTPEEYSAVSHMKPKQPRSLSEHHGSLDDLVDVYPKEDAAEYEDRKVFVDLLKWLLDLDGDQRISPCKALQHPFVTMSHLIEQPDGREYLFASQILMSACPAKVSADRVNTTAASGFNVRGPHCGTSDDPPASSSLDGRTSTACCGEERPSGGVKAADISVSSEKLPKRIHRYFSRIRASCGCCRTNQSL
ncbi:homeodomain-interacting protein kinase 1-like [Leuresthes tenuis]|uniref:homeodomain-interacting protein kinase 1-like n=1 Tax=Leuresthes tenuis TaxID=355514 RepID=UPI003B5003A4